MISCIFDLSLYPQVILYNLKSYQVRFNPCFIGHGAFDVKLIFVAFYNSKVTKESVLIYVK